MAIRLLRSDAEKQAAPSFVASTVAQIAAAVQSLVPRLTNVSTKIDGVAAKVDTAGRRTADRIGDIETALAKVSDEVSELCKRPPPKQAEDPSGRLAAIEAAIGGLTAAVAQLKERVETVETKPAAPYEFFVRRDERGLIRKVDAVPAGHVEPATSDPATTLYGRG